MKPSLLAFLAIGAAAAYLLRNVEINSPTQVPIVGNTLANESATGAVALGVAAGWAAYKLF